MANAGEAKRNPAFFDWERFRALFDNGSLPAAVLADPWVADWSAVAEKTARSGWDKRRVKARFVGETSIIPPETGRWFTTSPFAAPVDWVKDGSYNIPLRSGCDVWLSRHGVLKVGGSAQVWRRYF
jgi:hypothetical protein